MLHLGLAIIEVESVPDDDSSEFPEVKKYLIFSKDTGFEIPQSEGSPARRFVIHFLTTRLRFSARRHHQLNWVLTSKCWKKDGRESKLHFILRQSSRSSKKNKDGTYTEYGSNLLGFDVAIGFISPKKTSEIQK
jgi:hypothetical protein